MNYPLWELPAPGLLIAFVAIVHVFVSHFAVGGGLFLVLAERKARREDDPALLDYVRRHSRFFILLTLVFGAVTGVGIWFTIGLVHPAATSSLINAFVWGWAIEWTFFFTEIAAAIVYYYGWDKLTPRQHLTVGWIYFGAAWASLAVINGILAFMLTPGAWLGDHAFWSGFFNPGYWPSLAIRTLGAVGLAGVYALMTATWLRWTDEASRQKLVRWAATRWVLPMAIAMPLALWWYFSAAGAAGVPVTEIFGVASTSLRDLAALVFSTAKVVSGQPIAVNALRVAIVSLVAIIAVAAIVPLLRVRAAAAFASVLLMVAAFGAVGGSEWTREAFRKPYVVGSYMFVNGLRLPPPAGSPAAAATQADRISVDHVAQAGVLASANFVRAKLPENPTIEQEAAAGAEVYRLLCSGCHTQNGYLAIRPLLRAQNSAALEGLLSRIATPRDAHGQPATWSTPNVQLASWRNRRMPPFAGTDAEKRALAVYLAQLGGGTVTPRTPAVSGSAVFESSCAMCHGDGGEWPIAPRVAGKSEEDLYAALGDLDKVNDAMPDFEGTDAERHALAHYLATLGGHQ